MKLLRSLFIVTIIALFGSSVYAQNLLENKSGIGPRFGYYKAPDAEDGTMFFGVQSRFRGKIFGGELAFEYRGEQDYTVSGGELSVRQIPVTASLMAYVPVAPNFQPYGVAGLGAYYTITDYDGNFINSDTETQVNVGSPLGFGLALPISNAAALNIDYRYLYLDGDNENLPEKEYSGNAITGGLTFYF